MRRWLIPFAAMIWPALALAQTDGRDYLTALLEDNLSGAGRSVVITGFEGALASQARMAQMTIADDQGIWITLTDVVLDWQRSDLLAGRITVNTLSAATIDLARLPQSQTEIVAEAQPFSLPELPLSVSIGEIRVDQLRLGASVLGEEVTAKGSATLQLGGGEGRGSLRIERLDQGAPTGRADVIVSYINATRLLDLDLTIAEGAEGLFATAIGIPGRPAIEFAAKGTGPMNSFTAQISLRSDDQPRLTGSVQLTGQDPATGKGTMFDLNLAGDVTVLLQPDYRPFFGDGATLRAAGSTRAQGGFDLEELRLNTQAMQIAGRLSVGSAGVPERFDLSGLIQDPNGAPVRLPLALEQPATLSRAEISASFDAALGESWRAALRVENWGQADLRLARAELAAAGSISETPKGTAFAADLSLNAEGLAPARAALSRALGSVVWGGGRLQWVAGQGPLMLSGFALNGDEYQIRLDGTLGGMAEGGAFSGKLAAMADDLGRFSDLLGQPVGGAGELSFDGRAVLLTGAFDGEFKARTRDLAFGLAAPDAMLAGDASIRLSAMRNTAGLDIRQLQLDAKGGTMSLSGKVAGAKADVAGAFQLYDMPLADRGFAGQVQGDLALTGTFSNAVLALSAKTAGLDIALPSLRPLLAQNSELSASIALIDLVPRVQTLALSSPLVTVNLLEAGQSGIYQLTAELRDLGVILPQFPGVLRAEGSLSPQENGASLALMMSGPAGLALQIDGTASAGPGNDLRLTGRADAGLINAFIAPRSISGDARFSLTMRGKAGLSALAGEVALQGAQMADPALPFTLRNIDGTAILDAGQIAISLAAQSSSGGTVQTSGTLGASAPYLADISIAVRGLGLRNSDLIDTALSGNLRFAGPMDSGAKLTGRIDLGRTEVRLRPTELPAAANLPSLQHSGDTAAVAQTRQRAGRVHSAAPAARAAPPIALDVTVYAANRVFVRGRGLDAELGGQVRLQGTSADVRPSGAFDLVQGRFEILTKRLTLEEVRLEMQGQLIPYLYVRATNVRGDVITSVVIDGPAVDPDFLFSASPEMPQEEVLAQLLFDQNLTRLSALQGVQLAGAVAALSGRGEGIIARIRDRLKLDDLDVQTTTSGAAALKLGKYISDNVYSEVTAEGAAKQGLDFTYSLNEKIKLRAGTQTTGNTSLGIEFETNY